MGAILGFVLHLRGKGLWIGFIAGSILQSTLLCLITGFTNWKKQVCSPSTYFLKKCLFCLQEMLNMFDFQEVGYH